MVPQAQQNHGLSITLAKTDEDGPWVPLSVAIVSRDLRHRITFRHGRPMEEVFRPELIDMLVPVLSRFDTDAAVFANPEAQILLPGLRLEQLRVIHTPAEEGPAQAQVRFARVAGNPHRALRIDDGCGYPVDGMAAHVYQDALNWVLMPALNLATLADGHVRTEDQRIAAEDSLARLRASRDQLLFQIELVKRELGRLERRDYANLHNAAYVQSGQTRPLLAAEPPQENFATTRVLRALE
ncbi:hypothetical protein [Hasllibacter sp. MH4015]|uniref:hypothetical protein n=1 Tax=Hasllibacter sp. MH4015 TaxID=2854029 RepID=UPI001CD3E61C|nr:hypothetical protein [Hasllibacter sp. MH4015]